MANNTALQVTNFNFFESTALKDNATGEIYTVINHVLRGIGFVNKDQLRRRRDNWINDVVISKGVMKFNLPSQEEEVVIKNDTTLFDEKDTYYISQRKLPLASKNQYYTKYGLLAKSTANKQKTIFDD